MDDNDAFTNFDANVSAGVTEDYHYEPYSYLGDPTYLYPLSVAMGIGVLGVLGNGFVLVVLLGFARLKFTPSSILVIHQTVTDALCSVFILLTYGVLVTLDGKLEGRWGDFVCKVILSESLFWTAFVASSFSLVSITLERYLMVVHPVYHRNHFKRRLVAVLIVLDWLLAALFLLPYSLVSVVQDKWCSFNFWPSEAHQIAYTYIYLLGTFCLPVSFLVYGYSRMIHILLKRGRTVHGTGQAGKKPKFSKSQINITMTMVAVAVVYVVCLLPYQVYYFCYVIIPLEYVVTEYYPLMILSLGNCCINPFIYAVKFEAFKNGVRKMFGVKVAGVLVGDTMSVTN